VFHADKSIDLIATLLCYLVKVIDVISIWARVKSGECGVRGSQRVKSGVALRGVPRFLPAPQTPACTPHNNTTIQ